MSRARGKAPALRLGANAADSGAFETGKVSDCRAQPNTHCSRFSYLARRRALHRPFEPLIFAQPAFLFRERSGAPEPHPRSLSGTERSGGTIRELQTPLLPPNSKGAAAPIREAQ